MSYIENISCKLLKAMTFGCQQPFTLALQDKNLLIADEIVRIMPGRRIVVFGKWQGKEVVAKLFFESRHLKKELAGIKNLNENKVPAPQLYFQGNSEDKLIYVLIMERILNARSLTDVWQNRIDLQEVLPTINMVLIELATQHVLGIPQHDLHLNNFLVNERTVFTLDFADIEMTKGILPKQESMTHLALFISQLGVLEKYEQALLFSYYAKARGWLIKANDLPELMLMIKKHNEKRWHDYQKKILRESSKFSSIRRLNSRGIYNRYYASETLLKYLHDPELFFKHPDAKTLKAGRSSTVIKLEIDQYTFVIKRYNIKNFMHGLRRAFRRTRAFSCWRLAHKLNLFHVPTANPVAFIENNFFGIRGKSYYITEYIPGRHAGEYFAQQQNKNNPENKMLVIKRITQLLRQLFKLEIIHGDLKITNIIIDEQSKPFMIDFDGAIEYASLRGLHKAWRKEIERFLLNFEDQQETQLQFKIEMT